MSSKPIIAVCGATGAQGGSVVDFLLNDPDKKFAVRGLTRNTSSAAAKALVAKGVEVVAASFEDAAAVRKAFEGVYGVFGNVNFWDPSVGADGERRQGKILVDAAKATGVKHFVWSTLDHTALKVDHFESKADVDDYLKESGVPRTSLYTAWYYENIGTFGPITRDSSGKLSFSYFHPTDGMIAAYSVQDTGGWVLPIFKNPQEWIGKDLRVVSETITPRQIGETLTKVLGEPVSVEDISFEKFEEKKGYPIPELWRNNKFFLVYPELRDHDLSAKVFPGRKTLAEAAVGLKETWLASIKSA